MEETAYKLADGIEPYDVTEWRESSAECDYCGEGWDLEEKHRHRFYVHRDGAAVRTADELARVFQHDTAALVAGYVVPEWITALELDRGTGSAWCEDPDDAQALYDAIADAESALCDVGLSSYWDDGYVIESVELESDSAAELESDPMAARCLGTIRRIGGNVTAADIAALQGTRLLETVTALQRLRERGAVKRSSAGTYHAELEQ